MARFGFGVDLPLARAAVAGGAPIGFDFTGGALPAGATLTRASTGTHVAAAAMIASAAAGVARFEHDIASGAMLGLLAEPARANAILHADDLSDPVWSVYRGSVKIGASSTPAPDGSPSALEISFGGSGGAFGSASAIYQGGTVGAAGAYVASLWLRAIGAATSVRLGLYNGETVENSGDVAVAADRWTRVSVGHVLGGSAFQMSLRNNAAGDSGDVLAWGGQLEPGDAPSSIMGAAGASASRAADVLTLDWGSLGAPDGAATLRYSYADGGHVDMTTTIAAGLATTPTDTRPLTAARLIS